MRCVLPCTHRPASMLFQVLSLFLSLWLCSSSPSWPCFSYHQNVIFCSGLRGFCYKGEETQETFKIFHHWQLSNKRKTPKNSWICETICEKVSTVNVFFLWWLNKRNWRGVLSVKRVRVCRHDHPDLDHHHHSCPLTLGHSHRKRLAISTLFAYTPPLHLTPSRRTLSWFFLLLSKPDEWLTNEVLFTAENFRLERIASYHSHRMHGYHCHTVVCFNFSEIEVEKLVEVKLKNPSESKIE